MSRALAGVACVVAVAATGVAVWNAREVASLRSALEAQALLPTAGGESLDATGAPGELGGPLAPTRASVPERVAQLETQLAQLEARAELDGGPILPPLTEPSLPATRPEDGPAVDAVPSDGAAGGQPGRAGVDPEALDAVLEAAARQKVEEALAAAQRRKNKRPSLDRLAAELKLDDTQKVAVQRDLEHMQHQILEVLRTPTTEGWTFHDVLIDVWADPDKDRQAKRWQKFKDYAKQTKIPGTETSYQDAIDALKGDTAKGFARILDDEQFKGFESWELDVSGVDYEGSPFHTQLREPVTKLLQERQAAAKASGG